MHGDPVQVSREKKWDYYDRSQKAFIYLSCRLQQKHYTPSLLQIEEAEKYQAGSSTSTYETPDLQLHDTNGIWFTRSDDPEMYRWPTTVDDPKICSICDIVCDIRDMQKYMRDDGSCPYDDPAPQAVYSQVQDRDESCRDFLHPLLLQDLEAINRKRRRMAKAHIGKYLKQKKWRDLLITKEDRMVDVWQRNYKPVTFYFNSFETIVLYLKNLPAEMMRSKGLLRRVRENLELSPSYRECLESGDWEKRMLARVYEMVG